MQENKALNVATAMKNKCEIHRVNFLVPADCGCHGVIVRGERLIVWPGGRAAASDKRCIYVWVRLSAQLYVSSLHLLRFYFCKQMTVTSHARLHTLSQYMHTNLKQIRDIS